MKKIDARKYRFTDFDKDGPFGFLHSLSPAVEEVNVTNLEGTIYDKNGVHFSVYGSGAIYESAGMLLEDGTVLFCIVSGSKFVDTFSSNDDIRMKYYLMHEL